MKDDSNNNKKDSLLKSLAIAGFIAIIIIISWLSVQLVNVMPNAFSSLATLAEGLNQQSITADEDNEINSLTVTSNTTLINTGESVEVTWGTARIQGTYSFSYSCTSGVSVDILDVNNGLRNIACDTNYNIGNTDSITIAAESEKKRFENIDYTVSFLSTDDTAPRASGNSSFTVINSAIPDVSADDSSGDTEEVVLESEEVVGETEETPVVSTPVYEQEFVYTIPTSDPNGRTDLSAKFIATGHIFSNTFIPGTINQDDSGALQFEVKNYGTKTSGDWTYTMTLPGGGTYSSTEQAPLKPNERAVITIGFPTTDKSRFTFATKVSEPTDKTLINNQFSQTVNFVK